MDASFSEFGLYVINEDYLKYLYACDNEVMYDSNKNYQNKPFIGILINLGDYNYFIPLTSAKPKHATMRIAGKDYYLLYEEISNNDIRQGYITKARNESTSIHIWGMLDMKKMIPVPAGLYQRIEISRESDVRYRDLLINEYRFCRSIRNGILQKSTRLYNRQIESGKIQRFCCDFQKLEKACDDYNTTEH